MMSLGKKIIDGLKELNSKLKNNDPIKVTQIKRNSKGKLTFKKKTL